MLFLYLLSIIYDLHGEISTVTFVTLGVTFVTRKSDYCYYKMTLVTKMVTFVTLEKNQWHSESIFCLQDYQEPLPARDIHPALQDLL